MQVNKYKVVNMLVKDKHLLSLDDAGIVRKFDDTTSKWIPMNELPTPLIESELEMLEEDPERIREYMSHEPSFAKLISEQNRAINALQKGVK